MNLPFTDNPYKTLGVERSASEAEIKQSYFALIRQHSPERDPEGFKRIRAAYEKLRAGGDRAQTDLFLIDERFSELKAEDLQAYAAAPTPLTLETINRDLVTLEAQLLFEEAVSR
ncbi:MAG TPA: DnaJ domain-containing protein [Blastocatellia bacterium]|nr:DnaJ domain-containing protein [Blastocatellia bacterium]HMX26170.1 DnaJ domain-containing protein [Blastocatellia bacterium]HMY71825.1 DnaJ domain-containing protein [Blastocatellia bacterium]HMZ22938.1 DnaJ domain-containing protein [Blastocatellia bacterium]HNG34616.1 DnaJ domain-containing protein [Blastocatellia bacterium]